MLLDPGYNLEVVVRGCNLLGVQMGWSMVVINGGFGRGWCLTVS